MLLFSSLFYTIFYLSTASVCNLIDPVQPPLHHKATHLPLKVHIYYVKWRERWGSEWDWTYERIFMKNYIFIQVLNRLCTLLLFCPVYRVCSAWDLKISWLDISDVVNIWSHFSPPVMWIELRERKRALQCTWNWFFINAEFFHLYILDCNAAMRYTRERHARPLGVEKWVKSSRLK